MPNREDLSREITQFLSFHGIAGQELDGYLYFCEQRNLNHTDYNSILLYKEYIAV